VEPTTISISYTYIWDLLQKVYEYYGCRWQIDADEDEDGVYVISFGYETEEISHVFKYGFDGGLLKVERSVQSSDIKNILLGRGGETNLPYRYFKDTDADNPSFKADPDWIPELANIYFSELRGKSFRDYVRGWKAKHYNGTDYTDKTDAYMKGYTDEKFNPIEYVKCQESIDKYGEFWGGLDSNEDIYPTIQGIIVNPYGRVDEVVDVEQVTTDEIVDTDNSSETEELDDVRMDSYVTMEKDAYHTFTLPRISFSVEEDKMATVSSGTVRVVVISADNSSNFTAGYVAESPVLTVYKLSDSEDYVKVNAGSLSAGDYQLEYSVRVQNTSTATAKVLVGIKDIVATLSSDDPTKWTNVFDIWVKNIWGTTQQLNESDTEYADRVWNEIIGDRWGNEAKIIFSSGWLATSEDYEFTILKVYHDTSHEYNGVKSEWRITLAKSDADYDSLGLYVPSTMRQGSAGDFFFFTGIDMPHQYVLWAEEKLDNYKNEELHEICDITPTWNVTLDKIRVDQEEEDGKRIIDAIGIGKSIRLTDSRFIATEEDLFIQTVTYTYSDALLPDVEITLADDYVTVSNPVSTIQADVEELKTAVAGSTTDIDAAIQKIANKKYLRKDSSDTSAGRIAAKKGFETDGFVKSMYAGKGFGVDANGNLETESIRVRSRAEFLEMIVNRLEAIEGDKVTTESDTIDTVEDLGDNCYGLHLRSKWDGYFTAQAENNVIKGIINTLAAGSGTYYTSWMRVNSVNAAANYIEVSLYPDDEVPAGKNFPPCATMTIARWGNQTDKTRQSCLYLDSTTGRFCKLRGVTKPILEDYNYGSTQGTIPDWLEDDIRIDPDKDYVYAMGVICQSIIKVNYKGEPVAEIKDAGVWTQENADAGMYHNNSINDDGEYEITDAWLNGCRWRCMKDKTTNPPAWNSTDWAFVEGNPEFTVSFLEPEQLYNLDDFRMTLTVVAKLYNFDVTDDILTDDIEWTRYSEDANGVERVESDNLWALNHAGVGKSISLTYDDLDADTSSGFPKKIRFKATVTLRDGMGEPKAADEASMEYSY
jgi:hypothetical protein